MKPLLVLLGLSVLLAGCATMTRGTEQKITVKTNAATGANCTLKNDKGKWTIRSTPAEIKVRRSNKPLEITCYKHGYGTGHMLVKATTGKSMIITTLVGGVSGTAIDAASGALNEYPEVIVVPMK